VVKSFLLVSKVSKPGFDSLIESEHKTLKRWYSQLPSLTFRIKRDSVENKPAIKDSVENKPTISLILTLGKALNGMPLPLSG